MTSDKPFTERQLRDALDASVACLRDLMGRTGTIASRSQVIDTAAFKIAAALDLGDVGWNPLEKVADRLRRP